MSFSFSCARVTCAVEKSKKTKSTREEIAEYHSKRLQGPSENAGNCVVVLIHLIEKTEREIYSAAAGQISPKEFRHNLPSQRATVVSEVHSAWAQVTALATSIDTYVNDSMVIAAVQRFQGEPLDGYDLFLLEAANAAGVRKVITDDGDFSGVPGIQLFTKNQRVLTAAQTQGKLVVR